jgi:hypothetical protein
VPFTTRPVWQGTAPNQNGAYDKGWIMDIWIPFASLGLAGPPAQDTEWGMALAVHDRDDAAGTAIPDAVWPEGMIGDQPGTWGELVFGLPSYVPPAAVPRDTVTIRDGLDGASVVDVHVGGDTTCGVDYEPDYAGWGDANYAGDTDFNIQNQGNVHDWPCFSKYYVTFPLDAVPAGKVVLSATLTLHQFGGSGGPGQAEPSLIQVLTVGSDWSEGTLTWNNAPLSLENVARTWVYPLAEFPDWPGVAHTWDVSRAAAAAYTSGTPLRLALYDADWDYHSGKYFVSSDTGEWNAEGRPTLRVTWGDPVGTVEKTVSPGIAMPGETLTYTLVVAGGRQPLALADDLPAGVGDPVYTSPGLVYTPHRLSWTGTPSLGTSVVLSYVVPIIAPSGTALWNQAVVTQGGYQTDAASALVLVDPVQVYLPVVGK